MLYFYISLPWSPKIPLDFPQRSAPPSTRTGGARTQRAEFGALAPRTPETGNDGPPFLWPKKRWFMGIK